MARAGENRLIYREVQRFGQWWLWVIIAAMVGLEWWSFIEQIILGRPFGDNPAPDWMIWLFTALFGVGLPWLLLSARLIIEVRPDALYVRFIPFHLKFVRIDYPDILSATPGQYNPILDYGGWGIKCGKKGRVYNVSGKLGVMLELHEGQPLMLGSRQPAELALAINTARQSPGG